MLFWIFIVVSVLLSLLAAAALHRYLDSTDWDTGESWLLGFFVVAILFALIGGTAAGELVMAFGLLIMLWILIFEGVACRRENNKRERQRAGEADGPSRR
jgi:amino acid permease